MSRYFASENRLKTLRNRPSSILRSPRPVLPRKAKKKSNCGDIDDEYLAGINLVKSVKVTREFKGSLAEAESYVFRQRFPESDSLSEFRKRGLSVRNRGIGHGFCLRNIVRPQYYPIKRAAAMSKSSEPSNGENALLLDKIDQKSGSTMRLKPTLMPPTPRLKSELISTDRIKKECSESSRETTDPDKDGKGVTKRDSGKHCALCNQFVQANFRLHARYRHFQPLYACPVCDGRFVSANLFYRHAERVHALEDIKPINEQQKYQEEITVLVEQCFGNTDIVQGSQSVSLMNGFKPAVFDEFDMGYIFPQKSETNINSIEQFTCANRKIVEMNNSLVSIAPKNRKRKSPKLTQIKLETDEEFSPEIAGSDHGDGNKSEAPNFDASVSPIAERIQRTPKPKKRIPRFVSPVRKYFYGPDRQFACKIIDEAGKECLYPVDRSKDSSMLSHLRKFHKEVGKIAAQEKAEARATHNAKRSLLQSLADDSVAGSSTPQQADSTGIFEFELDGLLDHQAYFTGTRGINDSDIEPNSDPSEQSPSLADPNGSLKKFRLPRFYNPVRNYFYDAVRNFACKVINEDGRECLHEIKHCHTTNMLSHLNRFHKEVAKIAIEEKAKAAAAYEKEKQRIITECHDAWMKKYRGKTKNPRRVRFVNPVRNYFYGPERNYACRVVKEDGTLCLHEINHAYTTNMLSHLNRSHKEIAKIAAKEKAEARAAYDAKMTSSTCCSATTVEAVLDDEVKAT